MWKRNSNTNKWEIQTESVNKSDFNLLRQEIDKMRFYSKCLDGTSYLPINSLDNIYSKLQFANKDSWFVGSQSQYSVPYVGNREITDNSFEEYDKYKDEYGMGIKNQFTDSKVITDSINNYLEVDVISTEEINNLTGEKKGLIIDGERVLDGHKVLIKDQKEYVTLSNTIDPDVYFMSNYYIVSEEPTTTTDYFIYSKNNGIYIFTNNRLIRTDDLIKYKDAMRYSVVAKLGNVNFDKQFHLSRLKDGYFPLSSNDEPIEFLDKHNWVLRNKLQYQNVLDVSYNGSVKHDSYTHNSYNIPERTVGVGDFGTIIINQNGVSNIVKNKYKSDLKSIDQTDGYYWICGENSIILRVSKIDLGIKYIELETFHSLNSISFFNGNRGVAVGNYNTVYYTLNGGDVWKRLEIENYENLIFNKCLYTSLNTFYVIGNNGLFMEFNLSSNQWIVNKTNLLKREDINNESYLKEDLNDIFKVDLSAWGVSYNTPPPTPIEANREGLIILGANNTIIMYDLNGFLPINDYLFLSLEAFSDFPEITGDIQNGTMLEDDVYIYNKGFEFIYTFDINSFSAIYSNSNVLDIIPNALLGNITINGTINSLYNFNDTEIIVTGDKSLFKKSDMALLNLINLDSNFGNDLKSKMLFLDYDMASKINWYDGNENYRLPNDVTFIWDSNTEIDYFKIESQPNEMSWIDYMKDENKVFKYNENLTTSNEILMSTNFIGSSNLGFNTTGINDGSEVSNELSDIGDLFPTVTSPGSSMGPPNSSTHKLFLYDNLMALKIQSSTNYSLGDVFNLDSDVINGNFVVNRIETFGSYKYLYFYSNFNGNIINDLNATPSNITMTNLNIFQNDDIDTLLNLINKHPISEGYEFKMEDYKFNVSPRFNEKTAYYNLQSVIGTKDTGNVQPSKYLQYDDSFIDFGYSPIYNIKDYLENINPTDFNSTKEFGAMPIYKDIPYGGSYIQVNINKLYFDSNFKYEYDTIWKNTFIDIEVYGSSNEVTMKALVLDKYYDEDSDRYIISLSKKIKMPLSPTKVDIKSRRLLTDISEDLKELNNIHKGESKVEYGANLFYNLQNELNFKVNTESYAKIFLSDLDIKNNINSLFYIDSGNHLSMNIINLGESVSSEIIEFKSNGGYLHVTTSTDITKYNIGDYITIEDEDGVYTGVHIIQGIIDNKNLITESNWISSVTNKGMVKHYIFDEYLNYTPTDIIDVGIDKKSKIAVNVKPNKIKENIDGTVSIFDIDLGNYKFKLIDNLSIVDIENNFKWILEADVEDALIGQADDGTLLWYNGIWHCGRWFNGKWYSGTWRSGQWYDGEWYSIEVDTTPISGTPNLKTSNNNKSFWYGGDWRGGQWHGGKHLNGNWYGGEWFDGEFSNGNWHQGNWKNGIFSGGVWIDGVWENGILNCDSNLSTWVNGSWKGGDFQCGVWENGIFTQESNVKSRFGTRSNNTYKSIWKSGKWFDGEFHSYLNTDTNGDPIPSLSNKYSIWETGIWNNGNWYGGTSYNINYKGGTWHDGISRELKIVGLSHADISPTPINTESTFLLKGIWNFNRNDEFWLIDNQNGNGIQPNLGSNETPVKYLVKGINLINGVDNILTEVYVYKDLTAIPGFGYTYNTTSDIWEPTPVSTSNHSLVSYFKKSNWKSGLWENGIFDGDNFRGGMWMNGVFLSGEWS